jgi:hypothetical protein
MGNGFRQTVSGIFSHQGMKEEYVLEGHRANAIARGLSCGDEYLLVAQDTTYYNYSGHHSMEGLGYIQGNTRGIIEHNALMMSQSGRPLGILHQEHWTRNGGIDYAGKESEKWHRGLEAANRHLGGLPKRVVLIQDREADILGFFKSHREANLDLLVRVCQPRKMELLDDGPADALNLPDIVGLLPSKGQKQVEIMDAGRKVRLTLALSAGPVRIHPDKDLSVALHSLSGLSLVVAEETARTDCSTGESLYQEDGRAVWILLTSLPIDSHEDVGRAVAFYAMRWLVERLHFTLKSGALNVERLQFDDVHTMAKALAFHAIVAWRLLDLTYWARENQEAPASMAFEAQELEVLGKVSKNRTEPIKTVKHAILALASVVGFAPSKKQPMPGVKVLAQALERFHFILLGFDAGKT